MSSSYPLRIYLIPQINTYFISSVLFHYDLNLLFAIIAQSSPILCSTLGVIQWASRCVRSISGRKKTYRMNRGRQGISAMWGVLSSSRTKILRKCSTGSTLTQQSLTLTLPLCKLICLHLHLHPKLTCGLASSMLSPILWGFCLFLKLILAFGAGSILNSTLYSQAR